MYTRARIVLLDLQEGLRPYFSDKDKRIIIAENGEGIVGYSAIARNDFQSFWLDHIIVDGKKRGKGIGTWLVDQTVNYVIKNSIAARKVKFEPINSGFWEKYKAHSNFDVEIGMEHKSLSPYSDPMEPFEVRFGVIHLDKPLVRNKQQNK